MDTAHVLGAPRFVSRSGVDRLQVPAEEREIAAAILAESGDGIALQRSREYRSIVRALDRLELPFAIFTPSDPAALFRQPGGREVRRLLRTRRLLHAPDSLTRSHSSYPRDLMHVVNDVWLINACDRRSFGESPDPAALFSELGEGGRVLHAGGYVLHPDAVAANGEPVRREFALPGATCLPMPQPWLVSHDREGPVAGDSADADHLDRYGCLLEDARRGLHLIVNHGLRLRAQPSDEGPSVLTPEATDDAFATRLAGTPVAFHRAPPSPVPQILNLIQDHAGRILMSGGDERMRSFVENVTSREVHTTDVPIRYYPVFSLAGIRCLLGEMPRTFFEASTTTA